MKKTNILAIALVVVAVVGTVGVAQRARGGAKGQQAIVETSSGTYERGWVHKEGKGKMSFVDESGKTTELPRGTKMHSVSVVQREYRQYEQSIMNQDLKPYEKYSKLLAWAQDHCLYEEVIRNAERIIRENPSTPDPEAQSALKTAREKLAIMKSGPSAGTQANWTVDDIQKVRFAFLPTKGRAEGVRVSFKKLVLQEFLADMAKEGKLQTKEQQREFMQRSPAAQAQAIKTETANKYQPNILIGNDPPQMVEYRKTIEPLLNRSCAMMACHGSGNPAFKLIPRATKPQDVYANFYSLDTYKGEKGSLIDHGDPANSLFLSYLIPSTGDSAHPTKIVPVMKTDKDPRYRQVVQWIRSLPPQPIDEAIENQGVTTQPAPKPEPEVQ